MRMVTGNCEERLEVQRMKVDDSRKSPAGESCAGMRSGEAHVQGTTQLRKSYCELERYAPDYLSVIWS